jgi:hypothetical protein
MITQTFLVGDKEITLSGEHYHCYGSVRGDCWHRHRTLSGAFSCLKRDQSCSRGKSEFSDRAVMLGNDVVPFAMKKLTLELTAKTREGFLITDPDKLTGIALSIECHLNSVGALPYFSSNEDRSKNEPKEAFIRVCVSKDEDIEG